MNMKAEIQVGADRQLAVMGKHPQHQTITQLAEANDVALTFINQTTMELSGATDGVFDLIDQLNPIYIRIIDVDDDL